MRLGVRAAGDRRRRGNPAGTSGAELDGLPRRHRPDVRVRDGAGAARLLPPAWRDDRDRARAAAGDRPGEPIGSLFLNPGGPGGSGSTSCSAPGPFLYTDVVRARFDLVGFDPRGIIRSSPLRCFDSQDEWPPFPPFAFPLTREQEHEWAASDRALERRLPRAAAARSWTHMSTANVARDLDVLRRRSATGSSPTPASPTAPTSAPPTPTVPEPRARARGRRDPGPDRLVDRPRRARARSCRSRPACAATPARWRR